MPLEHYNCTFCPRGFSEYYLLKGHVKREHPEISDMLRSVLSTFDEKEQENMLPNAGAPRQGGRAGNEGTGLPYLKADMLSTKPKEARILMVSNEPRHRFGPSVVVKLEMDNKKFLWTLNINNNPNFAILLRKFGKDENEWADKEILLVLEQDEFSEQLNIRTHFPEAKKR